MRQRPDQNQTGLQKDLGFLGDSDLSMEIQLQRPHRARVLAEIQSRDSVLELLMLYGSEDDELERKRILGIAKSGWDSVEPLPDDMVNGNGPITPLVTDFLDKIKDQNVWERVLDMYGQTPVSHEFPVGMAIINAVNRLEGLERISKLMQFCAFDKDRTDRINQELTRLMAAQAESEEQVAI